MPSHLLLEKETRVEKASRLMLGKASRRRILERVARENLVGKASRRRMLERATRENQVEKASRLMLERVARENLAAKKILAASFACFNSTRLDSTRLALWLSNSATQSSNTKRV